MSLHDSGWSNWGSLTLVVLICFLQVDGSWEKATTRDGHGWAYKMEESTQYVVGGGSYGCNKSALQEEAQACLQGLQWAKRENIY